MIRYQTKTEAAMTQWKWQTLLGVFKPRLILVPFAIINRIHEIPNTDVCFRYKEVFVFGVRLMRFQLGA
jgi:hypothetical protein